MPPSLRQIKNRIRSIGNTQKVTNAMQMVSVAKLSRVNKSLFALRPYFFRLGGALSNLVNSRGPINNDYFQQRQQKGSLILCVIASDSGLCGLYNYNVLRKAEEFISREGKEKVSLMVVGKRGVKYFKNKGLNLLYTYTGLQGTYNTVMSDEIAGVLTYLFLSKEVDAAFVAYTHFKSTFVQNPVVEKFLNIEIQRREKSEYIVEQDFNSLLDKISLKYIITKMRMIFLEAFVSEHAARSIAMKTATDNASELLEGLTLMRNKIRQANITREMIEIISSAEALRG